jgi:pimeloyl-ACP methyl ester carboxylesterase
VRVKDSTTRAVAALVVLAMLLAGAGLAISFLSDDSGDPDGGSSPSSQPEPTPTVEPTPDPGSSEPPTADLAAFYSQELAWEGCRGQFQCSRLTVPVDYADPGGPTIELEVLKVPADDPSSRVGSLVVNPGGPGAPGTSYAEQAGQVFRSALTDHFDVVGFDPRGTGESAPVDCLSDEEMDGFLQADPVPDDAEEVGDVVEGLDDFWAGCVANTDGGASGVVAHVTTIEAARDMDVLRAALGEDTLTYFGASYGTKLGATYADLFPDKVGRLVLDGAVDVGLDSVSLSLGQAEGFERALSAYVDNCVEEGDCFLGDTTQEGLDTIAGVLADLDQDPLPTNDDRELTVGTGFLGVITPLYNRDYWYLLDQGLETALDGDGTTLQLLADAYASRNPDGSYSDNSTEAIYAINCLDDPFAVTPDEVPDYIPEFLEASPTLGEVFAWGLIGCGAIEVESSEPKRDIKGAGAAPIVVVGTTRDPATPYEWAVSLADQLESGVLVSRDGDGHTGYNSGNECVDEALEAYLVEGTVPQDGLEC